MGIAAVIDVTARELMLFAAAGLLLGGIDDLVIDLVFLARLIWRRGDRAAAAAADCPGSPPPIAVAVATWREAAVIGAMLSSALARYGRGDYTIFVAAYPNDPATIDAIAAVAAGDGRVRLIVNPRPGPTTKADNLNAIWSAVIAEERRSGRPFAALLLHDAEDLVHADELAVCGRLIAEADVVQLPVVPLVHPASPFVSGHYADEFAESHGKQLIVRAALGAGMPLAGTGCALGMPMLRQIAAERGGAPFDPTSLVEDYEMGLAIAARGGRGVFARACDARGKLVAVRAYFPGDFTAAARQKARWMTGIALAGWDRTGWGRPLAVTDHWWRLRDRRAPLSVVVLAAAYLALLSWALSATIHFWRSQDVPTFAPAWLLAATTGLLAWRLLMRVCFTTAGYGWRQGLIAVPRFLVGNMIALAAAPRALATYFAMLLGAMPTWDKTEHEFPATRSEPSAA